MEFDVHEEIARLWEGDPARGGRASAVLVKEPDLRIVLMVVRGGVRVPEHKANGRLAVQTVQGRIRLGIARAGGREAVDMPAGRVLVLEPAVPHDVEALEDSAFLLTIAWPAGSAS
jgi:quercetin dioxygenase-like cupin family protein